MSSVPPLTLPPAATGAQRKLAWPTGPRLRLARPGLGRVLGCSSRWSGRFAAAMRSATCLDADVFERISVQHWLGTDYLGRDMLSRYRRRARTPLAWRWSAALLASTHRRGARRCRGGQRALDRRALSRLLDTLISIPSKMFALVMVAAFGSSLPLLMHRGLDLCARRLPYRALAGGEPQRVDYVRWPAPAAKAALYIMLREILPNIVDPMLADFGLRFVYVVLLLASLSFLGLGVQPPMPTGARWCARTSAGSPRARRR